MFRFFANNRINDSFELSKNTLKHIKVARVEKEKFIIINNESFFICKLVNDSAQIIEKLEEDHEHQGEVIIAASFISTKRFEWLIQKSAELGATKLIPIFSKNVSKKISGDVREKINRWNAIAKNASEQSFRNKAMIVESPKFFKDACDINIKNKYIAFTKSDSTTQISFPVDSIFYIGPEGGYSEEEIEYAKSKGIKIISLGKRVLRAETASLFVLSRVN